MHTEIKPPEGFKTGADYVYFLHETEGLPEYCNNSKYLTPIWKDTFLTYEGWEKGNKLGPVRVTDPFLKKLAKSGEPTKAELQDSMDKHIKEEGIHNYANRMIISSAPYEDIIDYHQIWDDHQEELQHHEFLNKLDPKYEEKQKHWLEFDSKRLAGQERSYHDPLSHSSYPMPTETQKKVQEIKKTVELNPEDETLSEFLDQVNYFHENPDHRYNGETGHSLQDILKQANEYILSKQGTTKQETHAVPRVARRGSNADMEYQPPGSSGASYSGPGMN